MRTPVPKCVLVKLQNKFLEIKLQHGRCGLSCNQLNLLHIFRAPFLKNIPGRALLTISSSVRPNTNSRLTKVTFKVEDVLQIISINVNSTDVTRISDKKCLPKKLFKITCSCSMWKMLESNPDFDASIFRVTKK